MASDRETGLVLDPKYDANGLITAVCTDAATGEVLMLAHMNKEALAKTLETATATFWSRSRGEYWRKGDTSGHVQHVKSVALDCDGDAVLVRVDQVDGACHTGSRTCFDDGDLAAYVAPEAVIA